MELRKYTGSGSTGTFRPMITEDLHPNAVAASCLDDQYIDRTTLLSKGAEFRQRYTECVLDEFKKCLLSAEQIVVNRVYLQNTEVMQRLVPKNLDHADDPAIVRLIDDGKIVPYLYSDDDPTLKASVESGAIDSNTASAWNRVCERTEPHCLRLSWDESQDLQLRSERLATRFAQRLQAVAEAGRPDLLLHLSYHCTKEDEDAFGRYLRDELLPMARDVPTRRQLYERLIVTNGSNIAETAIDLNKKFAKEIKQLIDLVYNANLAGALGLNNVTPSHSVSADLLADTGLETTTAKTVSADLAAAVAGMAVRMQHEHYDEETVPLLGELTLDQIVRIRDHSSWRRYVRAVSRLRDVDTSLHDNDFYSEIEEAFGSAIEQCRALRDFLYQHHSAKRQARGRTRSLIAQVGSVFLGAAIGTAAGPAAAAAGVLIPGVIGSFASNFAGGFVHNLAERPLRHLAMKVDPLGLTFAAWRLPELKLDGGQATMTKFRRELEKMGLQTAPLNAADLASPTIEAKIT